jgi:hypothetical protein
MRYAEHLAGERGGLKQLVGKKARGSTLKAVQLDGDEHAELSRLLDDVAAHRSKPWGKGLFEEYLDRQREVVDGSCEIRFVKVEHFTPFAPSVLAGTLAMAKCLREVRNAASCPQYVAGIAPAGTRGYGTLPAARLLYVFRVDARVPVPVYTPLAREAGRKDATMEFRPSSHTQSRLHREWFEGRAHQAVTAPA